jgi:hypothetical protein
MEEKGRKGGNRHPGATRATPPDQERSYLIWDCGFAIFDLRLKLFEI